MRRTLGSPVLFVIVYAAIAAPLYYALGVVGDRALGLTPVVFLLAGVLFVLAAFTYVEGASLHQDRAGATVFARYAFNELVSFVAGWAILLDYIIVIAVTALSAAHYLVPFVGAADDDGWVERALVLGTIAVVAVGNVRGFSLRRVRRVGVIVLADLALQLLLVVLGLVVFFDASLLLEPIDLGTTPAWSDVVFALGVTTVVFLGLESASGLSGEIAIGRRGLKRLVGSAAAVVIVLYAGIALVAVTAMPVVDGETALGRDSLEAPVLGITMRLDPQWLADGLTYVVAVVAFVTLYEAANSAMLGLSRLAYSLSTNRQIPSRLGRLHPTRATPFVLIIGAAVLAALLATTGDLDFLVGTFAFGALLTLTIAHVSLVVLRVREPDTPRPYRMPLNVPFRGRSIPLTAVAGALSSAVVWVSVIATHTGARVVGPVWMLIGVVTYVVYRRTQGKPLLRRVVVPEAALKRERRERRTAYGSILVPVTGSPLDDDIVQTAGRLAAEADADEGHEATIEAIWVYEVPMSLPLDAPMPEAQREAARAALRRAKAVGEEYEGVLVQTATVRGRRRGAKIVDEARRRGVQVVIMGAEPPSRQRGGALLGGRAGSRTEFLGDVTRYVAAKAPCPVLITAPPVDDTPVGAAPATAAPE